jgi:molybdopterin-guanine dinucleotide biosynthesis protein A
MTPERYSSVVAVVLAGGRSRRMGGVDKSFAPLDGRPLLAHVVDRIAPQVAATVISANGEVEQYVSFGLPVIADTVAGHAGPLAGFLAGLEWTRVNAPSATHVVTVAADTPFFPVDLVPRLRRFASTGNIAVARSGGRTHNVFVLLPVSAAPDLAAFLSEGGSHRVADWLGRHRIVAVDFGVSPGGIDPFFNVNTPEDLARAGDAVKLMVARVPRLV